MISEKSRFDGSIELLKNCVKQFENNDIWAFRDRVEANVKLALALLQYPTDYIERMHKIADADIKQFMDEWHELLVVTLPTDDSSFRKALQIIKKLYTPEKPLEIKGIKLT